jgi:hypothetical protein
MFWALLLIFGWVLIVLITIELIAPSRTTLIAEATRSSTSVRPASPV